MPGVLVDSNIIIDLLTENAQWFDWSAEQIERLAESNHLYINPIIYAEISVPFQKIEDFRDTMIDFVSIPLTEEIAFLAAKAFERYKRNGGSKNSLLPDFFIGAQAAIQKLTLLTRDTKRYAAYFPTVELVAPCSY